MKDSADRIRTLIKERNMTQKSLALTLKLSDSSLSNYLQARRSISLPLLRSLCLALDISPDYIIGLNDYKNPATPKMDEQQLLALYRSLSPHGKRSAMASLKDIASRCQTTSKNMS